MGRARAALRVVLALAGGIVAPVMADVLRVGAGEPYASPAAAARAARDGDTIEITAGTYAGGTAVWTAHRLTIRGIGGRPLLDARGVGLPQLKAIWVVKGDDIRIENVAFANARSPDRNGAGIRAEGTGLVVSRCLFRDSETGLLASPNPASDIVVEDSEFARNGHADGQAHNLYIGRVRSFTLRNSWVHDARTGSQVKSRALVNRVVGNRIDDGEGDGNYLVDLANGGRAEITGNLLRQGPRSANPWLIAFAPEGDDGRPHALQVTGNTLVNALWYGVFVRNLGPVAADVAGNRFTGAGWLASGPVRYADNTLAQDWPWTWWPAPDGVRRVEDTVADAAVPAAAGGNAPSAP